MNFQMVMVQNIFQQVFAESKHFRPNFLCSRAWPVYRALSMKYPEETQAPPRGVK